MNASHNPEYSLSKCRDKLPQLLPQVIQELYRDIWDWVDYDTRLYRALGAVLEILKASSLAIIDADQRTALSCVGLVSWETLGSTSHGSQFRPQLRVSDRLQEQLRIGDYVKALVRREQSRFGIGEALVLREDCQFCDFFVGFRVGSDACWSRIVPISIDSHDSPRRSEGAGMFCGVLYHWSGLARLLQVDVDTLKRDAQWIANDLERSIGSIVLPVVLDSFRYYERRFAAFPALLRERYWQSILLRGNGLQSTRKALAPPWDICVRTKRTVPTVTLSLDLRKSTYCMEYASSNRRFGRWLEMFTEKMRSVAHYHGGIYDKFTGDGCLVHFLDAECMQVLDRSAVDSAVHCAVDMQRVVERHMVELRKFLQHDSQVFGAGIAIDVNEAHWACDFGDNPVVVGRGVVGACRVGDKAARHSVRLTNVAYHRLSEHIRNKMPEVNQRNLETKESTNGLPLQCWEFDSRGADGLGFGQDAMKQLCREVYDRFPRDQDSDESF